MVTGAAPGLGKSTLARRLAERLSSTRRTAIAFLEDEITTRSEFAEVMSAFRTSGVASRRHLLEASRSYIATSRDEIWDVVVQDVLFPFLPSLLAWGHSDEDITAFFLDLADACSDFQLVQIHLEGDPAESLPRAIVREDDDWLAWMIAKVNSYADVTAPVTDLESLVTHLRRAAARTRWLLTAAPWPVLFIEADASDRTTEAALYALQPLLS